MAASVLRKDASLFLLKIGSRLGCQTTLTVTRNSVIHQRTSPSKLRVVFSFGSEKPKGYVPINEHAMVPEEALLFRERFIPITRKSVIRHLVQERDFLNDAEREKYEKFCLALDGALTNKYHGVLQELKNLYDPINPDKDTVVTRKWNQRERLDNEFWVIQKLALVMDKANFHELPKPVVEKALKTHFSREGVMVTVDPNHYALLRFWALGKETPEEPLPWYRKLFHRLSGTPIPAPMEYYKRVVVACRLKKDHKLMLKGFKEVPVNALEQLLPSGKIEMTQFDKVILYSTIGIGLSGLLLKMASMTTSVTIHWSLVMSGAAAGVAVRAWTVYKNRRNSYLVELSRMLYYKNIANNRGLVSLMVDRAEDESFKEALLVYSFLLTNRPSSSLSFSDKPLAEIGGLTTAQLEALLEQWIYEKSGSRIDFDSQEAVKILKGFGLLTESDDHLYVLPLEVALRNLPQQPESIIVRPESEIDDIEGFDRDEYETAESLKEDDKTARKFGWS